MSIDTFKQGIVWAMKQNVSVQVVYPEYCLGEEYHKMLEMVCHTGIVSLDCKDSSLLNDAAVIVVNDIERIKYVSIKPDRSYVIRTKMSELLQSTHYLCDLIAKCNRVNVVLTDLDQINDSIQNDYREWLSVVSEFVKKEYLRGHFVQFNLLTDRFMLDKMNNCNAGFESIALAPDGRFYVCPAFYFESGDFGIGEAQFSIGDITQGVNIKNPHLYKLEYAPICRICDAYQCKRCVWLNRKITYEVNTPSHEQCVLAHLERNASRMLLMLIQEKMAFMSDKTIKAIDYLDPFEVRPKI